MSEEKSTCLWMETDPARGRVVLRSIHPNSGNGTRAQSLEIGEAVEIFKSLLSKKADFEASAVRNGGTHHWSSINGTQVAIFSRYDQPWVQIGFWDCIQFPYFEVDDMLKKLEEIHA